VRGHVRARGARARRPGRAHPGRSRGRLVEGLPLPQGDHPRPPAPRPRPAAGPRGAPGRRHLRRGHLGRRLRPVHRAAAAGDRGPRHRRGDRLRGQPAGPRPEPEPLHRRPDRDVGDPDDLLAGHGRPVAEERQLAPDVRRHVDHPRARRPPDRPLRRHGGQPVRLAGLAARLPRRDGRDRRHPGTRRRGGGCGSPSHGHRRSGRRVAAHHPRHGRRPLARRRKRPLRRRPRRPRRHRRSRRGRRTGAAGGRRMDARAGGARHRHQRRADPPPGPPAGRDRAGRRLRAHRAVQPGVRHAGQLAGRRGEHPHPSLRRARWPHVPAGGGVAPDPAADARPRGRRVQLRPLAEPGARRPRGARPRAGVMPGRGDRHPPGRGRSGRCSRWPGTPCSRRPAATASTTRWTASTA